MKTPKAQLSHEAKEIRDDLSKKYIHSDCDTTAEEQQDHFEAGFDAGYLVASTRVEELEKKLAEAVSVIEKYKEQVWRTGTGMTPEQSYAAKTFLNKLTAPSQEKETPHE